MRELLPDLENWLRSGERVALATVISTWGSAPRRAGSMMAINERGAIVGSVSGGCVEGAVIQVAQEVLRTDTPQRLQFGVADETAWGVGLACGGKIDIFVQPLEEKIIPLALSRVKNDQGSVLSTVIKGSEKKLGTQQLANEKGEVLAASNGSLATAEINTLPQSTTDGETEIFINPIPASPTLMIIGAVHIAVALVEIAHTLGFRTVIVDPRKTFATSERFPDVYKLIQGWPKAAFEQQPLNSSTAVASLSHDPKIDDPALIAALQSEAFYVGALGSRRTQEKRRQRLLEAGLSEQTLSKLHAPIGVEIGAETPEEIALAIMAQVISAYRHASDN